MEKIIIRYYIDRAKGYIKRFLINSKYRLKFKFIRATKKNIVYLVFEPNIKHPGIADRLKAIVSLYNHCKKYDYQFKLFFQTPFNLSDYLMPQFDWEAKLEDLEYSCIDTKIINMHPTPALVKDKQYHCYCYSGNEMPRVFPNTGYKWCDLFHELFKPSEVLGNAYNELNITPRTYISVHIRFVNALEHFENTFFDNHLKTQQERDNLINRCKDAIMEIHKKHDGLDVYVFSDSRVFLDSIGELPVKILGKENIGHISEGTNSMIELKSFLDLYVISQSKEVYRFIAPELYNWSGYAKLAATIGDIPMTEQRI